MSFRSDSESDICGKEGFTEQLGYGQGSQYIYIGISSFALLINLLFVFRFLKKVLSNIKTKVTPLDRHLFVLTIIEMGISVMWVLQTIILFTTKEINDNCTRCKVIGSILIFLYISDWILLTQTINLFKNIVINPIALIKNTKFAFIRNLLVCFSLAGVSSGCCTYLKLNGISVSFSLTF